MAECNETGLNGLEIAGCDPIQVPTETSKSTNSSSSLAFTSITKSDTSTTLAAQSTTLKTSLNEGSSNEETPGAAASTGTVSKTANTVQHSDSSTTNFNTVPTSTAPPDVVGRPDGKRTKKTSSSTHGSLSSSIISGTNRSSSFTNPPISTSTPLASASLTSSADIPISSSQGSATITPTQHSLEISGGAIAGVVIGSLLCFCLFGLLFWFHRWHRRSSPDVAPSPFVVTSERRLPQFFADLGWFPSQRFRSVQGSHRATVHSSEADERDVIQETMENDAFRAELEHLVTRLQRRLLFQTQSSSNVMINENIVETGTHRSSYLLKLVETFLYADKNEDHHSSLNESLPHNDVSITQPLSTSGVAEGPGNTGGRGSDDPDVNVARNDARRILEWQMQSLPLNSIRFGHSAS